MVAESIDNIHLVIAWAIGITLVSFDKIHYTSPVVDLH